MISLHTGKGTYILQLSFQLVKKKKKPLRSSDCHLNCLPYLECYFFPSPTKSFKKLISSMKSSLRPRAFAYPPSTKNPYLKCVQVNLFKSMLVSLVTRIQFASPSEQNGFHGASWYRAQR